MTTQNHTHIHVVYFSSATGNTHRFITKLGLPATRIPIRTPDAAALTVNEDYVLIVPTYGDANFTNFVPRQVIKFLNNKHNRQHLKGVISSGNKNFGLDYAKAAEIISKKCNTPIIGDFEIAGTPQEVETLKNKLKATNY